MNVIALRDMSEGEEVFLDYGPEWNRAYNDYRIKWEMSKQGRPWPLKAEDMRRVYRKRPLETRETLPTHMYPPNVATACFLRTEEMADGMPMVTTDGHHHPITQWIEPTTFDGYAGETLYIVDILDRREAPGFFYNYTLVARVSADRFEQVNQVPHDACTFVEKPYTSDISTPGAFRHPIGIIDSHFPQKWRNLRDRSRK